MEAVKCHLCCSSEIEELHHFNRNGDQLNVSICNGCGLVLLSPRWSAEEYRDFYSSQFSPLEIPPPEKHKVKGRQVWDRIQSCPISANFKPKNILDVGGGTGYPSSTLKH
ncbi:MAG: hypothetical protein IPM37_19610 [Hahellaceae bacterium]|nr:hypothetical protein [Hahellaceae bacterium]